MTTISPHDHEPSGPAWVEERTRPVNKRARQHGIGLVMNCCTGDIVCVASGTWARWALVAWTHADGSANMWIGDSYGIEQRPDNMRTVPRETAVRWLMVRPR